MDCMCQEEIKKIKARLATSAGHLKSIAEMLETQPCDAVLQQLLAVESNIRNTGRLILKSHLTHCVAKDIQQCDSASLEKFTSVLDKYLL